MLKLELAIRTIILFVETLPIKFYSLIRYPTRPFNSITRYLIREISQAEKYLPGYVLKILTRSFFSPMERLKIENS